MEEINEIKLEEIERLLEYISEDIFKAFLNFGILIIYAYMVTFIENIWSYFAYVIMVFIGLLAILKIWQAYEQMKEIKIKIKEIKQNLR